MTTEDEQAVRALYQGLIDSWNRKDAQAFAGVFRDDCLCVGFDGTEYTSRPELEKALGAIFEDHPVATYVCHVRQLVPINEHAVLLRAAAGMIPPGKTELMPERNAIQVMTASNDSGRWRAVSYQNTPAHFDGRPDAAKRLIAELEAARGTKRTH